MATISILDAIFLAKGAHRDVTRLPPRIKRKCPARGAGHRWFRIRMNYDFGNQEYFPSSFFFHSYMM